MELEKRGQESEGGAEAKNGDANNNDAKPEAETPVDESKDSTMEVENKINKLPDPPKDKNAGGDDSESGGSTNDGEKGNGSAEDGSHQSQSGDVGSNGDDRTSLVSESMTEDATAKQISPILSTSALQGSVIRKTEETEGETKSGERIEVNDGDVGVKKPLDTASNNTENTSVEAGTNQLNEDKKSNGDGLLGERTSFGTDGSNVNPSEEEKKEIVDLDRIDQPPEKSITGKEEDIATKVDLERNKTDPRILGDGNGDVSNSVSIDLAQSRGTKVNECPIVTTSSAAVAVNNSDLKEQDDEDDVDDAFECLKKKRLPKKKKAKKRKSIKIKIAGMTTDITEAKIDDTQVDFSMVHNTDTLDISISCHDSLVPYSLEGMEKELEDSLTFFEQPHEDQDPTYKEFLNKEKRDLITVALRNLQVEEESGKKEIGLIINQQLKDKQGNTERYIEKHRLKMASEQKNDLTRLQQTYTQKSRSNKGKIDHGIAVLRKKHSDENQKYLQQHRQQVQTRRVPEPVANAEWAQIAQRLNQKHNRQMHDFSRKGKEVMNKCKLEFERERTRITKVYEKRLQDLNTQRQTLYNRIYSSLQQTRQRHLKRHIQSIADRREAMEQELATTQGRHENESDDKTDPQKQSSGDKEKSDIDERLDLRPVSPIKTATDWRKESTHEPSGAATRHKHRKGVLSQINRQLSVEIHNEGIWLLEISEKKTTQNRTKDASDAAATAESENKHFFPWGVKARKILESIVCGEIPYACDSLKFTFNETVAQNGGHIRCVMTDLRTSDATASAQRAEAIMKKEVDELKKMEEREAAIKKNMVEMEKNMEIIKKQQNDLGLKLKETLKDYEKTKMHLQAFRTKYSSFFGPDGKPLPTNDPGDTRKLTQHGMKYKMAIESSEKRGIAIKTKISELHASLQKRQTNHKTGQRAISTLNATIKSKRNIINEVKSGRLNLLQAKSIENPTTRVKETINILSLTADMRRDQLNQKRTSNTSSHWVQSLPSVPAPLRRSLWYKMHRRRQQIVLRPTLSSMVTNMRNEIEKKITKAENGVRRVTKETLEDKMIKAEQSYLLVTHPIEKLGGNLTSLPSSSAWAEPGWHLKLDVEREDLDDRILPCPPRQTLVQYNLSELYSAPGSQAASMIKSTHLRSLETPLSAVATATSLSETDPAMAKSADPILSSNDPLKMTRDALKLGYAYSANKAQTARPTVTRRKSSTTKDTTQSVSTKGTKKKQSSSAPSEAGASKPHGTAATSNTARGENSRKRKSMVQSDPTSVPRAVQRKRTEPARQIPVDDAAFQPRPIMTPPQQQQQQQQQPAQTSTPFLQQTIPQQQQNPYTNQFMNTMPSPVAPQQQATHRGSFNQFQSTQMNQFRLMQQQQSHHHQQHHQQHSNQQRVAYGQMQQQPMRPNPQFLPQMGQQQFPQQPMQMPGQGGMQMNVPGNNQVRQAMATSDEQNDPLFMLKEM